MTRQEFNHQLAQYKYNVRSGSGIVTLSGGIKCVAPSVKFYGTCVQDGTPTPENPVPLKCNNAKWQACGKNLFDPSWLLQARGWTVKDGVFRGNISELYALYSFEKRGLPIQIKPNTQYSMSYTGRNINAITATRLVFRYTNMTGESVGDILSNEFKNFSKVSDPNKQLDFIYTTYGTGGLIELKNIQIEEGPTVTAYEPYHDGGTVDLSLLPNGGLYKVGDMRDEWDAATGKGIRRCGIISSYAGEEVGENWISSTGELSAGATVVYQLAEPVPFTATPQPIIEQNGYNRLSQVGGDIADTDAEATFVQHS